MCKYYNLVFGHLVLRGRAGRDAVALTGRRGDHRHSRSNAYSLQCIKENQGKGLEKSGTIRGGSHTKDNFNYNAVVGAIKYSHPVTGLRNENIKLVVVNVYVHIAK